MTRMLKRCLLLLLLLPAIAAVCAPSAGIPSAGRVLWLKADSLAKAEGDPVTKWAEAGGNGRAAVFTALNGKGAAPTYAGKAVNGKPAVHFAGNSLLRVNTLPLGVFTVAAVFQTETSGEILFRHGDDKDGCGLTTGATHTLSVTRGGVLTEKEASGEAAAAWAAETKAPVVVIAAFDGTDDGLQLTMNESQQLLTTSAAGALNTRSVVSQPFDIGARSPEGDLQFHGDLAELVVYDHVLPQSALQLLNATLMKKYVPPLTFTDPTRVNLLEQWNSDGSYALAVTASTGDPVNAVSYNAGGGGWVVSNPQTQPDNTVTGRFTFPQPVVLGQVMVQWRVESHAPTNYTFRDQNGVIVSDAKGPYDSTPRVHTFAPRTCEYLEFTCNPASTAINVFECARLGAYLAKGQTLPLTGATNILFEEDGKMKVTGSGYDPSWYGHAMGMAKPDGGGGNLTLHFSREYALLGAFLSQYDSNRCLANARIEISKDGVQWTTVYHVDQYHYRAEAPPRDKGYITWDAPPDTDFHARWIRLSWGANPEPVEITQWQVFGR